jgi:dsDNA-specific endonuclease/ATPase MutS2
MKLPSPDEEREGEAVQLPLDGRLDLHLFRPEDVPDVLDAYLGECRAAGVLEIEVVHGKGLGVQRRRVLALLQKRKDVARARPADEGRGGWGVTLVTLRP